MIVRTHAQRSVGLIGTKYRKEVRFSRVKGITRKRRRLLVDEIQRCTMARVQLMEWRVDSVAARIP